MKKALYKYKHILGSTNPHGLQIDLQNMIYGCLDDTYIYEKVQNKRKHPL